MILLLQDYLIILLISSLVDSISYKLHLDNSVRYSSQIFKKVVDKLSDYGFKTNNLKTNSIMDLTSFVLSACHLSQFILVFKRISRV